MKFVLILCVVRYVGNLPYKELNEQTNSLIPYYVRSLLVTMQSESLQSAEYLYLEVIILFEEDCWLVFSYNRTSEWCQKEGYIFCHNHIIFPSLHVYLKNELRVVTKFILFYVSSCYCFLIYSRTSQAETKPYSNVVR